jgi:hypothetical protein
MKPVLPGLFLCSSLCLGSNGCSAVSSTTSTSQACSTFTITINPQTVTLDHTVSGNAQAYTTSIAVPAGCSYPPLPTARWSLSDTIDASINATGVATCNNAALNPITVGAAISNEAATATLVCK